MILLPKSLCSEIEKLINGYWWGSKGENNRGLRWMAWNRLASPKSKGGLGVRDLHGFNLALLGKHIWNFSRRPDTLVARIFKERYFRDKHILQASRGVDPSFIWTGIWEAKEQMKQGYRWVLGDGKEISIFKDPWLQGKVDFRVEDNHQNFLRNEKVCSYFHPDSKAWDVHKVEHDFHGEDSKLILQTRIPQIDVKDRLAWTGSHRGIYTVKSGYRFWERNNEGSEDVIDSSGWNKLWNLPVPHKTRVFLWRFCRNIIPVRKLLRSRGVMVTIGCPMCLVDVEHLRHLFCECPFAVECWNKAGVNINLQNIESASEWLLETLSKDSTETSQMAATVLSGIWFARNKKVWEGKDINPTVSMELSSKMVRDWQEANKLKGHVPQEHSGLSDTEVKWQPPDIGMYKINVDASLRRGECMFTLGLVVRDEGGRFIMGKNLKIAGEVSVMEAEATGVLEAIKLIKSTGLGRVVIETDSQQVVRALHSEEGYQMEVGYIIDECKENLRGRADLSISHVRRQANKSAHVMARVPCMLNSSDLFLSPPVMLLEMLHEDFPS